MSLITPETKTPSGNATYLEAVTLKAPNHELDGMTVYFYPGGNARIEFQRRIVMHGFFRGGPTEQSQVRVRASDD